MRTLACIIGMLVVIYSAALTTVLSQSPIGREVATR